MDSRFQYFIGGKLQGLPDATCLMSSAESAWAGFLTEVHTYNANPTSPPIVAHKPKLFLHRSEVNVSWRAGGLQHNRRFGPTTVVFLDSGYQLNDVAFHEPWEMLGIELDEGSGWARPDAHASPRLPPHIIGEDTRVRAIALCMEDEIRSGCPSGKLYGESLSLALMSYLCGRHALSGASARQTHDGISTAKLRRLQDYIGANLECDLTLTELASLVDLSPRHLCRSFKQTTGVSPYRYIVRARIERAKALLKLGNPSIADVALQLGFSSQSHFSDTFRNHTGVSPRKYQTS